VVANNTTLPIAILVGLTNKGENNMRTTFCFIERHYIKWVEKMCISTKTKTIIWYNPNNYLKEKDRVLVKDRVMVKSLKQGKREYNYE